MKQIVYAFVVLLAGAFLTYGVSANAVSAASAKAPSSKTQVQKQQFAMTSDVLSMLDVNYIQSLNKKQRMLFVEGLREMLSDLAEKQESEGGSFAQMTPLQPWIAGLLLPLANAEAIRMCIYAGFLDQWDTAKKACVHKVLASEAKYEKCADGSTLCNPVFYGVNTCAQTGKDLEARCQANSADKDLTGVWRNDPGEVKSWQETMRGFCANHPKASNCIVLMGQLSHIQLLLKAAATPSTTVPEVVVTSKPAQTVTLLHPQIIQSVPPTEVYQPSEYIERTGPYTLPGGAPPVQQAPHVETQPVAPIEALESDLQAPYKKCDPYLLIEEPHMASDATEIQRKIFKVSDIQSLLCEHKPLDPDLVSMAKKRLARKLAEANLITKPAEREFKAEWIQSLQSNIDKCTEEASNRIINTNWRKGIARNAFIVITDTPSGNSLINIRYGRQIAPDVTYCVPPDKNGNCDKEHTRSYKLARQLETQQSFLGNSLKQVSLQFDIGKVPICAVYIPSAGAPPPPFDEGIRGAPGHSSP